MVVMRRGLRTGWGGGRGGGQMMRVDAGGFAVPSMNFEITANQISNPNRTIKHSGVETGTAFV